jgi:phosphoglycolate phosphatase-like HAD superfamily hydrolase
MSDRDTIAAIISDSVFADKDGVLQDIDHCAGRILQELSLERAAIAVAAPCDVGQPIAWIYETWLGADGWSKRLSFDRPAGNSWQRGIVPLYAAPQPQPDAQPPAAVWEQLKRDFASAYAAALKEHDEAVERAAARQARKISSAE